MGIAAKTPDLAMLIPQEIAVDAIEFNGTNSGVQYANNFWYDIDLIYEPTGTHTKAITLNFWIKPHMTAANSYQNIVRVEDAGGLQTRLQLLSDASSNLSMAFFHSTASSNRNSANILWGTGYGSLTANQWNHIIYSAKVLMASNTESWTHHLYANNVDKSTGVTNDSSFDAGPVQPADTKFGMETFGGAGDDYDGCMTEFYLDDKYYDLSSSTQRERFRSSGGKPVLLPPNPKVYLTGNATTGWTNQGSTTLGTPIRYNLTDCADSPSD